MRYFIERLTPDHWHRLSKESHLITFGEINPPEYDRVDFALWTVDEKRNPLGFITVKEMDAETAYLQHGGVFPSIAKTLHAFRTYEQNIALLAKEYNYLWFRVKNTNIPMIKFGLATGFVPHGTYFHDPYLYVEMRADFRGVR